MKIIENNKSKVELVCCKLYMADTCIDLFYGQEK